MSDFKEAAKLVEALEAGACWQDEPAAPKALRVAVPDGAATRVAAVADNWSAAVLPPLATKIYQESTLRSTREI